MKIVITENQLKKIIEAGKGSPPVPPKELEKRLKKAKKLALKFKNPRQFALKYPKLWNTIRVHNLIDDVFPDRKLYKPYGYWNAENIAIEARKYKSRNEFRNGNQVAYNRALTMGLIDFLFPEIQKFGKKPYYDLQISKEIAKNFEGTRSEFAKRHYTAYDILKDNGILNNYFPDARRGEPSNVSDEELLDKAKEYKSIIDLNKNNKKLYNLLYNRSLLNKLYPNPLKDEKILSYVNKAKEYDSIIDLYKNNKMLYIHLKNRSLLDQLYPEPLKIQKLLNRAKNYENKYDLRIKDANLYRALVNAGLWEKVFPKTPIEKLSLLDLAKDIDNTSKKD